MVAQACMRCLYAVLQVDQSADDAAIRSAYRKGALQWCGSCTWEGPESFPREHLPNLKYCYVGTRTKTKIVWKKLTPDLKSFKTHMRF